jgi:hypothetical protein
MIDNAAADATAINEDNVDAVLQTKLQYLVLESIDANAA